MRQIQITILRMKRAKRLLHYKIIVSVDYDADRDGGYSEHVYSVATDD